MAVVTWRWDDDVTVVSVTNADPEIGLARRAPDSDKIFSARQTTESESVRSATSVVLLRLVPPTDNLSIRPC